MKTRVHKVPVAEGELAPRSVEPVAMVNDPAAVAAALERTAAERMRKRKAQRRRRRATAVMAVLSLTAAGGFGFMGWVGVDAARNVVGGTTQEVITDPTAPGFVAVVDETRVSAVALTTAAGTLDSVLVFPEATTDGGTVAIWAFGELLIERDGREVALRDVFAEGGIEALLAETARVLGFAVSDGLVASATDITAIADFVAPITVRNPTPVRVEGDDGVEVRFPSGTIELSSAELGEFMTMESYGDPPENRGLRAEAALEALGTGLAELIDANPEAETAEDPTDFGGYLIRWGRGDHHFISLPTTPIPYLSSFLYRPDFARIADEVGAEVPFPASAFPGQRPRTRILNGTPDTSRASSLVSQIAALGAEVSTIGNAGAFDVAETTVVYSDAAFAEVADRIADYLGTSATLTDAPSDATDIDVVLGANLNR
ncbi:MAG: LytR C-terminal domain-containing protein [Actinobacteria bacterium]|nr:LytR C-terminal domain-containing protein [Actinomycetota bacterium]